MQSFLDLGLPNFNHSKCIPVWGVLLRKGCLVDQGLTPLQDQTWNWIFWSWEYWCAWKQVSLRYLETIPKSYPSHKRLYVLPISSSQGSSQAGSASSTNTSDSTEQRNATTINAFQGEHKKHENVWNEFPIGKWAATDDDCKMSKQISDKLSKEV